MLKNTEAKVALSNAEMSILAILVTKVEAYRLINGEGLMKCLEKRFDGVTGFVTWDVATKCPHCGKRLALNQHPYDNDETEYCLAEDELGVAVFGTVSAPAKWQGLAIAYRCCGCKKSFSLASLEV